MLAAIANYGGAQIYDRQGILLYRFPNETGGIQLPVRLSEISPALVAATVSTEDASFWTNSGIDIRATLHAALESLRDNGTPFGGRGGTGITQQLVKQTLIARDDRHKRSLSRKLREAIYAVEISRRYEKSQILEWYLNVVNYGGVYDGVESASQGYFGVHAKDLSLAQAAMLAGIPQSPSLNSPYLHPEAAKRRQVAVLDLMVQHGYVTTAEADTARKPLSVQQIDQSLPMRAPWFVEYVRQELITRFGAHCVQTCGLSVSTTLDITLQNAAASILETNLTAYGDPVGIHNGSLLSIDARTGEILVMLGSRRYEDTSAAIQGSNNFTTALLQPGSAFKPFVYLSLFMQRGYGPDSVIWDAPFVTADGYHCENPPAIGRTIGPIPVRLALGSSLNCAANRAAATAGVTNVIHAAEAMGLTTLGDPAQYGPSIATGGANVNLLELAYAYVTLARNGSMIGTPGPTRESGLRGLDPTALLEVHDATGHQLFQYQPRDVQVIPAGDAYLVTRIISDCQNRRLIWSCDFPGFKLADGRPVAVKTGTQQGTSINLTAANWQFMYTPQLVTGGWVGNADHSPWTDRNGGPNAVGFSVRDLTDVIVRSYALPNMPFAQPADVTSVAVRVLDRSSGLLTGCGSVQQGLFLRGTQPDINNRICLDGHIQVPSEQLGTGGLGPYVAEELPFNPTATFLAPAAGSSVTGAVALVARPLTSDAHQYRFEWRAVAPSTWTPLPAVRQIDGDLLYAIWNVDSLAAGEYILRIVRVGDGLSSSDEVATQETVTLGTAGLSVATATSR